MRRSSVVEPALSNIDYVANHFVDDPMFASDPARPVSSKLMSKRFRFPNAGEGMQNHVSEQAVNPTADLFVGAAPIVEVILRL